MMKSTLYFIIAIILLAGAALYVCAAVPEGPTTLSVLNSTKKAATATSNISAIAGNVTQLSIKGSIATQAWAGFYGNVSGTVTLENSAGERMYSWELANPQGEIYATQATGVPQFGQTGTTGNISCWNYTKNPDTQYVFYGEVEGWDALDGAETRKYTITNTRKDAIDSINNTFLRSTDRPFPPFYVGNQLINGSDNKDKCPSLATYNSSGTGNSTYGSGEINLDDITQNWGGNYQEVILIDTTNQYLLWTAIIDYERDQAGFDGNIWDFQMIVPEDGHGTNTATTEYNFYVELE